MKDFDFREIELSDRDWMNEAFAVDDRQDCEYNFANNYLYKKHLNVEVAGLQGCCVIRYRFLGEKEWKYAFPAGNGDKRQVILALMERCRQDEQEFFLSGISEEGTRQLRDWFPGQLLIQGDRDRFDYIYLTEKLTSLKGSRYHGKRNHIARFKDGDDWSYEPMSEKNIPECMEMSKEWVRARSDKWNEEMEKEYQLLQEAFRNFSRLGFVGGVLRKKGRVVAMCMGEPLNSDTFVVHFEKAFPDVQGAYPMINQQFVEHECQNYTYVNREDDTGDPGLRRAKLSYEPEILLKKYTARSSEVVFADPLRDRDAIHEIWETCFGDEPEFIDLYLDNRLKEENMLVIHRDGRPVSMASFLQAEYEKCEDRGEGEEKAFYKVRYVYAVATLPAYRGQGLAAKLLEFGGNLWGETLILSPGSRELCDYYEKLGFFTAFSEKKLLEHAAVPMTAFPGKLQHITPGEYRRVRDGKLSGPGYVRWDEDAIGFAMEFARYFEGDAVAVTGAPWQSHEKEMDLLLYYPGGEELVVTETTLKPKYLLQVLPEILKETGTRLVNYTLPWGMMRLPKGKMPGKICPETCGYLNLILG